MIPATDVYSGNQSVSFKTRVNFLVKMERRLTACSSGQSFVARNNSLSHVAADRVAVAEDVVHARDRPAFVFVQVSRPGMPEIKDDSFAPMNKLRQQG